MCAETIPLEAAVCEYCGAQYALTVTGYCTACHEVREADSSSRCKVCGSEIADRHMESKLVAEGGSAPVQAQAPASGRTGTTAQPSQPTGKKRANWLLSLGGIAFTAVCCTIFGLFVGASAGGGLLNAVNPFAVPTDTPTLEPSPTATNTPEPVRIRWLVGIASGTDPAGNEVNMGSLVDQAAAEFNASHPRIQLVLEKVPSDAFSNTLFAEIEAGNGPDIAGPMGVELEGSLHGHWLDITPYMESSHFDSSAVNPILMAFHHTDEGQITLPFEVYPGAVFYQKELFDKAGLNYPPASYGELYTWPDGTTSEWNFDTLAEVAKLLTIDDQDRNATQKGFLHNQQRIKQFGFVYQWTNPIHMTGFWEAGKPYQGEPGNYQAVFPEQWKVAWKWYYEGMWGQQLFIPSYASPLISENAFSTGKVAMAITQAWYTCCVGDAGQHWDLAALPSNNGAVHGAIHADSFYIWKGTQHPAEAFEVLAYLTSPSSQKLLVSFIAIPAATANQNAFLSRMAALYPWATNWDVFLAALVYTGIPYADGYLPNYDAALARITEFDSLIGSQSGLKIEDEIEKLRNDLTKIFNQ